MSLVHLVQGFDKLTEALDREHVIPLRLVEAVRAALGEPEDPDEDPGALPLGADLVRRVESLTGLRLDVDRYDWYLDVAQAEFDLAADWVAEKPMGLGKLEEASFGRIFISIAGTDVSAWQHLAGNTGSGVDVPLYQVADWIARNWWALLYEPHKGDRDAVGYRRRHWLGTARKGFALPDLWISPAGGRVEIQAKRCTLALARMRFTHAADSSVERVAVKDQLWSFVEEVLSRMRAAGIDGTPAHKHWEFISNTSSDQEAYCRLVGAMGLSPFDNNKFIDAIVERVTGRYDEDFLLDLCQAADVGSIKHDVEVAEELDIALSHSTATDLSRLGAMKLPADIPTRPWARGVTAAIMVRDSLEVSALDPRAANAVFGRLGVDTSPAIALPYSVDDESRISAAIRKSAQPRVHVALAGGSETQRNFAAARSVFFGLLAGESSSRLITIAKTHDQKASRSFSAEIVAPFAIIDARNKGRQTISSGRIEEIAAELICSTKTVGFQAINNGLRVIE